ncbi:phosphonate degradation HD-domain oxygenase [Pseudomonas agarici]|uniref:phosphonate degradation HD-domain oxygenase n=1 Tax=Pseudomonas agarici TaxID=46677 RepID=UPI00031B6113|nr:phosphonate degradation HD-domain oxygenase [Pseudomonas agarici]NWB91253.1 HD domain-containing protein [Pseudomonas agarici]NWC08020.1 HD domain-containing protein [Pseudomonas agarici]SEL16532.1 phosphonate degradation operons associated HDIG domain protein [Pseudomonas agarici]
MSGIEHVLDEVFDLYQRFGSTDYIGEPVSQLEHMSQAAQLAMAEGFDDEVVLAAFFHDIGHICPSVGQPVRNMGGYGVVGHERLGANYLRRAGFSERLAQLVEYHVQAKRYLTLTDPGYYERLSEASRRTLEYQGGVMTLQEAQAFELDPLFGVSLRMRQWDEQAKQLRVPVIDLQVLRDKAQHLLSETVIHTTTHDA